MDLEIIRYTPAMQGIWDAFVTGARNSTFLHRRDYMDYHSDRFADCSWLAYKGGRLAAVLPANVTPDGVLHSHQGLTYGAWLLPPAHIDGADLLAIFSLAAGRWKDEGLTALDYKAVPHIYCSRPSQEDEYALFRLGARLTECNLSSAVDLSQPLMMNKLRRRNLASARKEGWCVEEISDCGEFMQLVAACLEERHGASPVHTAGEMELLRSRFPQEIRMFGIRENGELQAGVMIYDTGVVTHAQYIATTSRGREANMLTPLFHTLITETFHTRNFFDFGISNEDSGRYLNEGLLRQKFSYGATGVSYNRYCLQL